MILLFNIQRWIIFFFALAVLVSLTGCVQLRDWLPWFSNPAELRQLSITRIDGSGSNQYAQIDIVFVYDSQVSERILPGKAEVWFEDRDSYLAFSKKQLEVVQHAPVPPSVINKVSLPKRKRRAVKIMAFVAYFKTKKYFQFDVTKIKKGRIVLDKKAKLEIISE